jgi:hypothetical protein
VVKQLLLAVSGLAWDGHADRWDMRKSLSCTRDLLLAFPRSRQPSALPVIPRPTTDLRCPCHTVALQSADTQSSPRQAARPYIAQGPSATRITEPVTSSEDSGRVASKVRHERVLAVASSLQKAHSAVVAEIKLGPSESHGPCGYAEPGCEYISRTTQFPPLSSNNYLTYRFSSARMFGRA